MPIGFQDPHSPNIIRLCLSLFMSCYVLGSLSQFQESILGHQVWSKLYIRQSTFSTKKESVTLAAICTPVPRSYISSFQVKPSLK